MKFKTSHKGLGVLTESSTLYGNIMYLHMKACEFQVMILYTTGRGTGQVDITVHAGCNENRTCLKCNEQTDVRV